MFFEWVDILGKGEGKEKREIVEKKEVHVELEHDEERKAGVKRKRDEEEFPDPEEDFGE